MGRGEDCPPGRKGGLIGLVVGGVCGDGEVEAGFVLEVEGEGEGVGGGDSDGVGGRCVCSCCFFTPSLLAAA